MREIYNFCNPRGNCKCPKVYELTQEEFNALIKGWENCDEKMKLGSITILFKNHVSGFNKFFQTISALFLFIRVALKTDLFGLVGKDGVRVTLHITDEEKPNFSVLFKK